MNTTKKSNRFQPLTKYSCRPPGSQTLVKHVSRGWSDTRHHAPWRSQLAVTAAAHAGSQTRWRLVAVAALKWQLGGGGSSSVCLPGRPEYGSQARWRWRRPHHEAQGRQLDHHLGCEHVGQHRVGRRQPTLVPVAKPLDQV